jgi:CBS domain-containing protein/sporulation protein YlmC with PRC-barrel domain
MIYFSELDHLPVFDAVGEYLGRLEDLALDPGHDSLHVAAYHVRTRHKKLLCITHDQMQSVSVRSAQTRVPKDQVRCYGPDEGLLHVKKDVLDQQIIDVNHRKVVRVNDLDLDIQPTNGHTELRIVAVNIGLNGAVRRLLQGLVAKHRIRVLAALFPSKMIPWAFVNLIEPDPARRLRLRISYDRLAELHPADIGGILEDLSRDERNAVVEGLDEETAAQALSEIPTHMQATILESIHPEKAADIVEEMPPDEAADVLQELPPETTAELLADMEKDEAREVQKLLGFEENTAGALMTTEFIVVGETATVEGAIAALRSFEGAPESVHFVYLIRGDGTLCGAVPLARILLAPADTSLKDLSTDPPISVQAQADDREVIELFRKYNLVSLPVVTDQGHLLGVVTADDVLELVVNRQ